MAKTKRKVLAAGTLVLDVIPQFPDMIGHERLTSGGTVYVDQIQCAIGGSAGNTGLALWKLGADTELFSKVGNDDFGVMIRSRVEQFGIPSQIAVDPVRNTSSSVVMSPPGSDRLILHCRGASQHYVSSDFTPELLAGKDLFHFGYPTGMACMYSDNGENLSSVFRAVKEQGLTTSLDLSFPGVNTPAGQADWNSILQKTLPYVDVFLPSLEEITLMLQPQHYRRILVEKGNVGVQELFDMKLLDELAGRMLEMGAAIVGIKCGVKGFYLRTAGQGRLMQCGKAAPSIPLEWSNRHLFTAPYVLEQKRSTNGAGDTSVAGFLVGLLLDRSPVYALQMANAAAANRISCGSVSALEDYGKLEQKIAKGWKKLKGKPNSGQWTFDSCEEIYSK